MERNSLSNDLKHHSICTGGGRRMKENNRNITKLKDSWDHTSYINSMDNLGGELLGGFSWPPRSYTCTFCKREFRSAQALGGHMNVHRRDRARLRQSPPRDGQFYPGNNLLNLNLDPNPNPNPNPNFSSSSQPSSPQKMFPPFTSKLPPLLSPSLSSLSSPSSVSQSEIFERGIADHTGAPTHHLCPRGGNSAKMKSQKTLLGVDKFNGFSRDKECKIVKRAEIVTLNLEIGLLSESKVDDLDLELRLGYS